jgi:hypothetical protein
MLLETAFKQKIDIVLAQEPWTMHDTARRISKWHPAYHTLTPLDNWEARPRILVHTRKDRRGLAVDLAPTQPHPDLLACDVRLADARLRVFCVYNAPRGSPREGEAVEALKALASPTDPELYAGDFNLHHEQ